MIILRFKFLTFFIHLFFTLSKNKLQFSQHVSVALNEHFVDDLKVDGLADGEVAEEESSTQKLYKKILAEQEKERKKAEARKAFDEATKPKPKPRAKSKTPQPEEVAAAAEGEAPVVYINPDGTPAEPGTPGAVPAPSNLGADQLPTDFRVPTPDEQANMSETVTVTYPQPGQFFFSYNYTIDQNFE
jgi:hypothetical protein